MEIVGLFVLGLAAVFLIVLAASNSKDALLYGLWAILGLVVLCLFTFVAAEVLKDGSPVLDIKAGQYKVAFVYEAEGNVSIGIESMTTREVGEHLHLYQFKKEVFDGQIITEATVLKVIESGDFKKLKLE